MALLRILLAKERKLGDEGAIEEVDMDWASEEITLLSWLVESNRSVYIFKYKNGK